MNIIGIDSGSSTVKIVYLNEQGEILDKSILNKMKIIKALEIFLENKNIDKKYISKIVLTGVGRDEVENKIFDIPVIKIDEFQAIGKGGLYLSNIKKALVVSIGTGTAFVMANKTKIKHIGGTGIGGGTILNLCKKSSGMNSIEEINNYIICGDLSNIDLTIQDIATNEIKNLPSNTTCSNFGKLNVNAKKEDITLGIVNMVFETIGMMAVFATQRMKKRNIVVIGNIATMPYINIVLRKIEKLHKVKFIIPKQAEFATIIGAIELSK